MSSIGHEESEVESIVESQGSNSSRKRKAYFIEKKLEAIDYAKKFNSKKAASDKFGISRSTVQDWVKQEQELRDMSKNSKRLAGAGRHLTFAELDVELASWVREQRAEKKKVSRRILKLQAVKIFVQDAESDKEFKASEGWLQKFMDRYKFRSRVSTTLCQKPPIEYEEALVKFVMYISQLREKTKYSYIFACDETAVWLDPSGGKCIAEKGAKEVSVLTTGHDKLRITVMLTQPTMQLQKSVSFETLFQVLSFLSCSELDALLPISSYFNQYIQRQIITFPLNSIEKLLVADCGEKEIFFRSIGYGRKIMSYGHSLEQLQLMAHSRKWMAKKVNIAMGSEEFFKKDWKNDLESISSLWQGRTLRLDVVGDYPQQVINIFHQLFTWSKVLTCDHFELITDPEVKELPLALHSFPLLYTFSTIQINGFYSFSRLFDVLEYLENIPQEKKNYLTLIVYWFRSIMLDKLLDLVKSRFALATSPCPFKLRIYEANFLYDANKHFRTTNKLTQESLEYYFEKTENLLDIVTVLKRSLL